MKPSDCPQGCGKGNGKECVNFVDCKGDGCENPCWKCLFWTNYGNILLDRLMNPTQDKKE